MLKLSKNVKKLGKNCRKRLENRVKYLIKSLTMTKLRGRNSQLEKEMYYTVPQSPTKDMYS